ncbi:MAG: peptidoglycan-binding protein [Anaerotardibacter sp.]
MVKYSQGDSGLAIEDIQKKLISLGFLPEAKGLGVFDKDTSDALSAFCEEQQLEYDGEVTDSIWSRLVDLTYELGDRTLYLRVPYFHGNDVKTLQHALNVLGFSCGDEDGMFGPNTEDALRRYQLNLVLPSDGIAGSYTFRSLINLQHSWKDKDSAMSVPHLGFARASEVLEENIICLFGTGQFARSVAGRMSNLATATNPASKIVSAESLLVEPSTETVFIQILEKGQSAPAGIPQVVFEPEEYLSLRIKQAFKTAQQKTHRFAITLPSEGWLDAGEERSAQHFAIVLLDALCAALV